MIIIMYFNRDIACEALDVGTQPSYRGFRPIRKGSFPNVYFPCLTTVVPGQMPQPQLKSMYWIQAETFWM